MSDIYTPGPMEQRYRDYLVETNASAHLFAFAREQDAIRAELLESGDAAIQLLTLAIKYALEADDYAFAERLDRTRAALVNAITKARGA